MEYLMALEPEVTFAWDKPLGNAECIQQTTEYEGSSMKAKLEDERIICDTPLIPTKPFPRRISA